MIRREIPQAVHDLDKLPVIPIAVSAHHVHLTREAVEQLFGKGYRLTIRNLLSQTGQWASEETVNVAGPKGDIQQIRILGPCRVANQIEIAESEGYELGIDVPSRLSGDLQNTPVVRLRGPVGTIHTGGLIAARWHIHTNPIDAKQYALENGEQVDVEARSMDNDFVFCSVVVRIDPSFVTEMHIDTDQADLAHIRHGGLGELMLTPVTSHVARIMRRTAPDVDHG
jgi:acetate kinase